MNSRTTRPRTTPVDLPMPDTATRFDRAYFDRFYRHPDTRAASEYDAEIEAQFVAAYLRHLDVEVQRIVDIGCGLGRMLNALAGLFPGAVVHGVDSSDYLCRTYGWEQAALPDFAPGRPFDLVVCQDVLAYLDDSEAATAVVTLGRIARKALYFGALAAEDLALCNPARTDTDVYLRPASWYRRRLGRRFEPVGGGLWLKKPVDAVIWTLDRRI